MATECVSATTTGLLAIKDVEDRLLMMASLWMAHSQSPCRHERLRLFNVHFCHARDGCQRLCISGDS